MAGRRYYTSRSISYLTIWGTAMAIMNQIQQVNSAFPQLDCGACGSPTCRALAEDIVLEGGDPSQCIFILKEQYKKLSDELGLSKKAAESANRQQEGD